MGDMGEKPETFDYIVVGGGTAGAVVASRLSEDPATSARLVEWGPGDRDEPRAPHILRRAETRVRLARRVASTAPMSRRVAHQVFPGEEAVTDEEFSAPTRATSHTAYHVSGTARMGTDDDPEAVPDPSPRVRGIEGLRVAADASAFPSLTTVNPVVTVLMPAERAADLLHAGR